MNANLFGGLVALLALSVTTGCNGGDSDSGTDTNETDTEETDTNVDAVGDLKVNSTFAGATISCKVNLDAREDPVGDTNTLIPDMPAGEHDLALGDRSKLSPDGIPTHDLGEGLGKVIAPLSTVTVVEGELTTVTRTFNRYIEGWWTCEKSSDPGNPVTTEVVYEDGATLTMSVMVDLTVTGEHVHSEASGTVRDGEFTSPTTLHVTSTGGMAGDYTVDCHLDD